MSQFTYASPAERVGILKGEILAHAIPVEVLGITGMQKRMPKNASATVSFRRYLPFGAASTAESATVHVQNQMITSSNYTTYASAQATVEGVTPTADTLVPVDITVALTQYHVLYSLTDKVVDLYEDGADVPDEMKRQTGERMGLIREMVRWGVLKAATNVSYSGGTSIVTTDEKITLSWLRSISRTLRANHAGFITSILAPSTNYATAPVERCFLVFCHTNCEADIRDLPGFKHVAEYGNRQPVHEMEVGSCESFRFILSPELVAIPGASGTTIAVGTTGLEATGGYVDVYPIVVMGMDAYGQVALRGTNALDPTYIPPGQKDKNDPLGQRGYIGAKAYFNAVVLNQGWMVLGYAGVTDL